MRILVHAPYLPTDARQLTELLVSRGHIVTVLTPPTGNIPLPATVRHELAPPELVVDGNATVTVFSRAAAKLTRMRAEAEQLAAIRAQLAPAVPGDTPDLLIAIDAELSGPLCLRAAAGRLPVITFSQGSDVLVVPGLGPARARNVKRALEASAGVMALSAPHAAACKAVGSGMASDPFLFKPWIDTELFVPETAPAPPELSPEVPTEPAPGEVASSAAEPPPVQPVPTVLCLRGVNDVYRPLALIEACAIALKTTPLVLRMAIPAARADEFRGHAARMGLPPEAFDAVTTPFPLAEMPAQYRAATVVAQALRMESFGYSSFEAMACGKVVVQPRSPISDALFPASEDRYVTGSEPRDLAAGIIRALTDVPFRQKSEAANRAFAVEHYARETVMAREGPVFDEWLAAIIKAFSTRPA
jgi:glycosyltransferase involved in cell wall biosynthesis